MNSNFTFDTWHRLVFGQNYECQCHLKSINWLQLTVWLLVTLRSQLTFDALEILPRTSVTIPGQAPRKHRNPSTIGHMVMMIMLRFFLVAHRHSFSLGIVCRNYKWIFRLAPFHTRTKQAKKCCFFMLDGNYAFLYLQHSVTVNTKWSWEFARVVFGCSWSEVLAIAVLHVQNCFHFNAFA